jgi:hypothetical protein
VVSWNIFHDFGKLHQEKSGNPELKLGLAKQNEEAEA